MDGRTKNMHTQNATERTRKYNQQRKTHNNETPPWPIGTDTAKVTPGTTIKRQPRSTSVRGKTKLSDRPCDQRSTVSQDQTLLPTAIPHYQTERYRRDVSRFDVATQDVMMASSLRTSISHVQSIPHPTLVTTYQICFPPQTHNFTHSQPNFQHHDNTNAHKFVHKSVHQPTNQPTNQRPQNNNKERYEETITLLSPHTFLLWILQLDTT